MRPSGVLVTRNVWPVVCSESISPFPVPFSSGRLTYALKRRKGLGRLLTPFSCGTGGISGPLSCCISEKTAMLRAVIVLTAILTLQSGAAAQGQRRAFVIGIAEYRELQGIIRPVGDARAVHDRLSQLGFTSELMVNADSPTLQDAFKRFTASLQDGDVAVVYFSGH